MDFSPVPSFRCSAFRVFVRFVLLFLIPVDGALSAEISAAVKATHPPIPGAAPDVRELAAQYEQTGRKREAAALYEALARTNTSASRALSHRLVSIYIETGQTNRALKWTGEVMRTNPDPQAYLAGVHARLGQYREAQKILEREITADTNSVRAVTLRWQLADLCEKEGGNVRAHKLLKEAAEVAKGTAMEPAARKRVTKVSGSRE